jgi:uncharacterized DUF497 family protein
MSAFDDPNGFAEGDPAHSQDEPRQRLLAALPSGRLIVVIFTTRSETSVRIISARPAKRKERTVYERRC